MEFLLGIIFGVVIYNIFFKKDRTVENLNERFSPTTILAKKGIGIKRSSRNFIKILKPDIEPSEEWEKIFKLLEKTNTNVFLTGKAGTGKSTLLKYFRSSTNKKVVVLAPTGVAAVNIQGQTIHSFFRFTPETTLDSIKKLPEEITKIYKQVDIIIIDEISMVRADLFDYIDKFLRLNGKINDRPFGGIQLFIIGDLYQLPPVVLDDEKNFFRTYYKSPYFFDSKIYPLSSFTKMELTHVYRQIDKNFIETLDALRTGVFDEEQIRYINTRVFPKYNKPGNEFIISLVTTNKITDTINTNELAKLSGISKTFTGMITGQFRKQNLPAPIDLTLKENAQAMILNNHPEKKWINGDIVKIIKIEENSIRVLFDNGDFENIGRHEWKSVKFIFDEETNKIQPEITGSFKQFPLKLAWAVTIHKGQGKTFNKARINFGNGTFAPGQAYVALSRCRSLEGIILETPLENRHVFIEKRVKEFMDSTPNLFL